MSLLEDELRFVFITSGAETLPIEKANGDAPSFQLSNGDEIKISVIKSPHKKCVRCWHLRADVGSNTDHPELCLRCVENVDGQGEPRHYA